ncbi:MAG: alkyl hydroperoxide reductase, partial [Novosphingobium sp. 35-62-5]
MSEQPPKRSGIAIWLPLALFGAFFALVIWGLYRPADREVASAFIGKPLPQFNLPAATKERPGLTTAAMTTGKPRLLNVFASWCVPCAVEAPQLEALRQQGVEIDGVAIR